MALPLLAGLIYFALAKYVRQIGPLRTLITGELTYKGAYLGFLFLGIYLASRPFQILFPHPWPLIVNSLREFCMIAVFGPAVFLAMLSLVFGAENIPRRLIQGLIGTGILLGGVYLAANVASVGGSEPIFQVGRLTAHDGRWWTGAHPGWGVWVLLAVRLIDPVALLFLAGTVVLWHARTYPVEKRMLYDNMPLKLYFLGSACYAFSLAMLVAGLLPFFKSGWNAWGIYYGGALAAGFLETASLALPMKKHVQVSEHQ